MPEDVEDLSRFEPLNMHEFTSRLAPRFSDHSHNKGATHTVKRIIQGAGPAVSAFKRELDSGAANGRPQAKSVAKQLDLPEVKSRLDTQSVPMWLH